MMTVTATDIQNNFGKYLQAVQMGDEIILLLPSQNCVPIENEFINIHCKQQEHILK